MEENGPADRRVAELGDMTLRHGADGIMHLDFGRDVWWEVEHAIQLWDTIESWTSEPVCLAVCLDRVKGASSASRSYGANERVVRNTLALGLWGGGVIGRFVGNLFMRLNRPSYPTHMFATEDEALRYVLSVRDGVPLSDGSGQTPQKG